MQHTHLLTDGSTRAGSLMLTCLPFTVTSHSTCSASSTSSSLVVLLGDAGASCDVSIVLRRFELGSSLQSSLSICACVRRGRRTLTSRHGCGAIASSTFGFFRRRAPLPLSPLSSSSSSSSSVVSSSVELEHKSDNSVKDSSTCW